MAGDWIAMRHDLWECPQVVRILSAFCPQDVRNMSARLRIIGALYRTWCLFDRFTEDGILHGYTAEILDEEIGWPGWAANLQDVGWLVIDEQRLVVPEFTEYFGNSARRRMKDTRRKQESRKTCPQSVRNSADKMRTTGQDNTEQNNSKKKPRTPADSDSIPAELNCPKFLDSWKAWQKHRQEIKKPLTKTQRAKQLEQFAIWGVDRTVEAINFTIMKGWQGIKEPDVTAGSNGRTQAQRDLAEAFRQAEAMREEINS